MINKLIRVLFGFMLLLLIGSCQEKIPYKITHKQRHQYATGRFALDANITLRSKMPEDSLLLLGKQLREEWPDVSRFLVRISVPSDYPDDKFGWWANYHYLEYGKNESEVEEYIQFLGPQSKTVEDSLKNIQPTDGKLLGRWYLKASAKEGPVFLMQKDSIYLLETHFYRDQRRDDTRSSFQEVIPLLAVNKKKTRFRDVERLNDFYAINPNGDLLFEYHKEYIARK